MYPMPRKFFGWWVAAAAFINFGLSVGIPYYNIGFFYDYFQREFHWSRADITLGFPLAAALTIWFGPIVIHRFSPRKLILVGTVLTVIALTGFANMGGALFVYYGFWVVYTIGYILSGPNSASVDRFALVPAESGKSHGHRVCRRRADGIARFISGEAAHRKLRLSRGADGAGGAHSSGLAAGVIRAERQAVGYRPKSRRRRGAAGGEPDPITQTFAQLLGSWPFWLLLIASFCSIGSIGAINFHMKFVFLDEGFEKGPMVDSAWRTASVLVLWSSIGGRLLIGGLADRFSKKWVMTGTYFLVAGTIPILLMVRPSARDISVHFCDPVWLRNGRRLHADPADGRRAVWSQFAGTSDGRHFAREHHRADLVSVLRFHPARPRAEITRSPWGPFSRWP